MGADVQIAAPFRQWVLSDPAHRTARVPSASWLTGPHGLTYTEAVMVVDVVLGAQTRGTQFRMACEPLISLDGTKDRSAQAGIIEEPDIVSSYSLGDAASQARSFSFSIHPAAGIDIPTMLAQGLLPTGIAEISLEWRNQTGLPSDYMNRVVVCRGVISALSFGGRYPVNGNVPDRNYRGTEIVEFEVSDPREICQSWMPPQVIDSDGIRFANPHPEAIGQRLPLVYNRFTKVPALRVTRFVSVVVSGTSNNTFVFAIGHGWTVDEVRVNNIVYASGSTTYPWSVVTGTDGRGTSYSAIYFDTDSGTKQEVQDDGSGGAIFVTVPVVWEENDVVHVTCRRTDGSYQTLMESLQDILSNYSAVGSQGCHPKLFADADAKLGAAIAYPSILINGSSSGSAANALDAIEQGILASYPMVSMVWQDGAYGPVVTDFRSMPVAKLVAGTVPLLDRTSLVSVSSLSDIYSRFTLKYAYDTLEDTYTKVVLRDRTNSGLCEYSEDNIGRRDHDVIESPYIQDEATANYVIDWMVAHKALPSYLVEYECLAVAFFTLRRGDTVTLTDDEFSWLNVRATVEQITYRRACCKLTLRVWVRFVDLGGAAYSYPTGP